MGHTLCLQPWTNITGIANQTIVQHDTEWADLAGTSVTPLPTSRSPNSPPRE